MENFANLRLLEISLSIVTTRNSVHVVSSPNFFVISSLITSLSAPESIIALTMTFAPEMGCTMRTETMGRMTLSFALTTQLAVVAASHRTDSCCAGVLLAAAAVLVVVVVAALPANGRKGSAAADMDDFFFGDSNFRS